MKDQSIFGESKNEKSKQELTDRNIQKIKKSSLDQETLF